MKTGILVIFLFYCTCSFSQNLVPNPSFEQNSSCPLVQGQIELAIPWFQPDLSGSSTDYYNICNVNNFGIPKNIVGYQYAKTGVAYGGFCPLNYPFDPPPRTAEYLEIKLSSPLSGEKKYIVSFYVSSADKVRWAIDLIGAYFSKTAIYSPDPKILSQYHPQIESTKGNVLKDTVNWVLISGSFIAEGGEEYMTIGNFNDSTIKIQSNSSNINFEAAYYYIDDVSVIEDTTTSIDNLQLTIDNRLQVYPNPFKDLVNISFAGKTNDKKTLTVENELGLVVYRKEMTVAAETIDLSFLAKGIYLVSVKTKESIYKTKLLKVE